MRSIPLHLQVLLGLVLGVLFAFFSIHAGWPTAWTIDYIKPFGVIFLNSLKMVAIPLIFTSLVVGTTRIEDMGRLSRIGGKTVALYFVTTMVSVALGLVIANVVKPGRVISEQTRGHLLTLYSDVAEEHNATLQVAQQQRVPLQMLIDLVPENLFASLSDNANLLQVVLLSIVVGTALLKVPLRKRKPVIIFFDGLNDALIEVIRLIMNLSPIGVFALVSSLLVEVAGNSDQQEIVEILYALFWYMGTTLASLGFVTFVLYPLILRLVTKMRYQQFFRGIYPAQLVAFSTSSSSAALPMTMECAEKNLGVSEQVSSFVLPLGATINMNGTALYQGIAIVFIAQALGIDLSFTAQLVIVINVVLSSIGVAGVPGASMITTTMILQSIGMPAAGIALILAPDRILDMCRTATNITGDAAVAVIVAHSEGELATVSV